MGGQAGGEQLQGGSWAVGTLHYPGSQARAPKCLSSTVYLIGPALDPGPPSAAQAGGLLFRLCHKTEI